MRLLLLSFILLLTYAVSGQTEQLSTVRIDSIVRGIDSTKEFQKSFIEGFIGPKGKKKLKGNYDLTYFFTPATHHLIKVERRVLMRYLDCSTYYLYQDSLIFVKIETYRTNDRSHKKISSGQYYFNNGSLFDKQEKGKPAKTPEALLDHARRYVSDTKKIHQPSFSPRLQRGLNQCTLVLQYFEW